MVAEAGPGVNELSKRGTFSESRGLRDTENVSFPATLKRSLFIIGQGRPGHIIKRIITGCSKCSDDGAVFLHTLKQMGGLLAQAIFEGR